MKLTKREKLDELFKEASSREMDDLINQYPLLGELEGKYDFSDKHNKVMKKIFKKAKRIDENSYEEAWKKFGKFSFRAAAIICMIFTILTMVAFAVPEIRVIVTNYIVERNESFTRIDTESLFDNNYTEDGPMYIPEGFVIDEVSNNDISMRIVYKNNEGEFIAYNRYIGKNSMNIDTENNNYSEIVIDGYKGVFNNNGVTTTIIFFDEIYTYKVISSINEEELKRIAESIIN